MAVRRVIRMGNPGLRLKARSIEVNEIDTPELKRLVEDMVDTLHDYGGIGLAATQVNVPVRLAIIHMPGTPNRYHQEIEIPLTICANPEIQVLNQRKEGNWEGCLSVPGLRGYVERPAHVRLNFLDLDGVKHSREFRGFAATVCQHELDHLDGTLFIDRITDPAKLMFEEEFTRYAPHAP